MAIRGVIDPPAEDKADGERVFLQKFDHPSLGNDLDESLVKVGSIELKVPSHSPQYLVLLFIHHDVDFQLLGNILHHFLFSVGV